MKTIVKDRQGTDLIGTVRTPPGNGRGARAECGWRVLLATHLAIAAFVGLSLASLSAAEGEAETGFRPLFDGRTLAGWVNVNCAPETWTVTNGWLHCDGIPTGALRSEKQYENFILELEWRHLVPRGNAGVFLWASPMPALGQPFLRAIEVQVLENAYGQSESHTTHGDVFAIHNSTMKPFPPSRGMRSFPTEHRSKSSPEWNHYRITCTNGVLRLAVNGKEVSGGSDCVWRKGYLALESEGGVVDWRNIRLKELPSSGATPEQTAPEAEPWQSLYDGRTLRGWKAAPGDDQWKAADWTLRFDGKGTSNSVLWAERPLGDFDFLADWEFQGEPRGQTPPFVVRSLEGSGRSIALLSSESVKAKGWNRIHLVRRGTEVTVRLNDRPTFTMRVSEGKVQMGLNPRGTPTRFSSLFVK